MPKRPFGKNTNLFLFNQRLKDNEHIYIYIYIYRDVAGYDMSYDEIKELCRKSWEEDYNYLCIDRSKKREEGRHCFM